ncbi:MAG: hypothetical protein NUV53_02715 [Patescibacteria group bacterium]|nr:hypothetical protein [Patescibacteria group bacterium]
MNSQEHSCKGCHKKFEIVPDDEAFYARVGVPSPAFCPDCRHARRLAIRNERTFYKRTCDSCKKSVIAYYPQEKPQVVWCPECWWSDTLDPFHYGRDFDFSRPFFEQFKEMYTQVPTLSLDVVNCHDSEYVSYCGDDKRCYLDIAGEANMDCYYTKFVKYSTHCADCSFVYNSELAYECVNCHRVNNCSFLNRGLDCHNVHLSYDCRGCTDCFGCWNLRNKQYYIFNQPYAREEYKKKIAELKRNSYATLELLKKEFARESQKALVRFAQLTNCINCTGDVQEQSKNVLESFDVTKSEDSKWLCDVLDAKDCYDLDFSLYKPEQSIELVSTLNMTYSGFCNASHFCNHTWYSDKCNNSSNLFGCIAVNKKQYCILNRQYEKESFDKLRTRIIEHMTRAGEWGEYFPVGTSGFGYNETVAQEYFPLTEAEAKMKGFPWWDKPPGTRGKETLKPYQIPDTIEEVQDSLAKEILVCGCGRNYRIVGYELDLYRKMGVPIPRECPECRHLNRNKIAGERKLWKRKCTCAGEKSSNSLYTNTSKHFHDTEECPNHFETPYAPERKEIVYCKNCYQAEVA